MVETVFFSIFIGSILTLVFLMFFMLGNTDYPDSNEMDAEIVVVILQNLELSLSQGERQAVDYAIESIRIREKLEEYFERMENK